MPKFEYKWIAPISFSSEGISKILREILEELGYEFKRDKVEKYFDKIFVIVPLFRFAYAFRFIIIKPWEFIVDVYDTQPTHSSTMPYIEIDSVNDENIKDIQRMLKLMVKKLPREPWRFTKARD